MGERDPRGMLEGGQRDLSVDRRVDTARSGEARDLCGRNLVLAEADLPVALLAGVLGGVLVMVWWLLSTAR